MELENYVMNITESPGIRGENDSPRSALLKADIRSFTNTILSKDTPNVEA